HVPQIFPEPPCQRNLKPELRSGQDGGWQYMTQRLAHEPFQFPACESRRGRKGKSEGEQPVVTKWDPQLERMGHAQSVTHPKEVVRKIGLQIQPHRTVRRLLGRPSVKQ